MSFKVSFGFNWAGERLGGWTENFYNQGTTLGAVLADAKALAPFLKAVHGDQSVLHMVRISSTAPPRLSQVERFANVASSDFVDATMSDYGTRALCIVMVGEGGARTRQWIKGIPDSATGKGGTKDFKRDYTGAIAALKCELVKDGSPWKLRVLDKTTPKKRISAITNLGVVTCTAHGYNDLSRVRLSGVVLPNTKKRVWTIISLDANTFQLEGYGDRPGTALGETPRARLLTFAALVKIVDMQVPYVSDRKIGRPLDPLGGSRRTR